MHDAYFKAASEICRILRENGHIAYFAGGWVRDYLLQHPSDDIDIATKASPEEVMALFSHTIPVGTDFGVVIVVIDDKPFEVSSFRKDGLYLYGRRPESISYATPEEDAHRRDFTINGMFYDPLEDTVYDFVGGRGDLKRGLVRAIGNPHARIREDRLRMIRGVRMSARFGFNLAAETERAIMDHADALFPAVAVERIWQEFEKIAAYKGMFQAIDMLHHLGLLPEIFPNLKGKSLSDIHKRIKFFPHFPHPCPAILYLAHLFQDVSDQECVAIFDRYKISKKEKKLFKVFLETRAFLSDEKDDKYAWVKFYALQEAELLIHIEAAKRVVGEREAYLSRHHTRKHELSAHIDRMRHKRPVVQAADLMSHGFQPGSKMGCLLREAEKLAINHNLLESKEVVSLLQKSPTWSNP